MVVALSGSRELTRDAIAAGAAFSLLKDVDPDGASLFLQRTVLRASLHALDVEKSTGYELIQAFTAGTPLTPGEPTEIRLSSLTVLVVRPRRLVT